MEQIIKSLLDTDAYKFSMGQAIFHQFSGDHATWTFKCRNENIHFTKEMVREIRRQVGLYCNLRFTEDELKWLPEKNIWLYSGYTYEMLRSNEILTLVDVLVDGPFLLEQKDAGLSFRGSRNQRIIDLKEKDS